LPASGGTPEIVRLENSERAVRRFVEKLGGPDGLAVCYEAGPGGYQLHRLLRRLGVACDVIAPSLIPIRAGDRVKTDRRDAKKLVRLYRAGELVFVQPPSPEQEGLRDLVRCRDDLRRARTAGRHRVNKQLLRHGHCPWQRCTVHFLRDCLGHARKDQHGLLAALIRPIFRSESGEDARRRLGEAVAQLERPLPKVAAMLEEAEEDILAFYEFPATHWSKLRSTDENVKGPSGRIGDFRAMDRSRRVLAGPQKGSCGVDLAGRRPGPPVFGRAGVSSLCDVVVERVVGGVRLRSGRGRPRSEAQVLGLRPAAQLAPQRAFQCASHWWRPRPAWTSGLWLSSLRRADDTPALLAQRARVRDDGPL
jgi:hypothetical protein